MQRMWWLNLIRGIVALGVGILILGWPTVGTALFVNFLAIFSSVEWGNGPAMGSISTSEKRIVAGRRHSRQRRWGCTPAPILVSALPGPGRKR